MKSFSITILTVLALFIEIPCAIGENSDEFHKTDAIITVAGTIQGLKSTMAGITCAFGEEDIVRSFEDTYILVTKDSNWFLMPAIPKNLLAVNINKKFQVTGKVILDGRAIEVLSAGKMTGNGKWKTVWPPVKKYKIPAYWNFSPFPY